MRSHARRPSNGTANGTRRAASPSTPRSREQTLTLVLAGGTVIALYLCYRVASPFLPALAWAAALAVVAYPLHDAVRRIVAWPGLAASLAVLVVALAIVVPAAFAVDRIVRESTEYARVLQNDVASGRVREVFDDNPRLRPVLKWFDEQWPDVLPAAPEALVVEALGEKPSGDEPAAQPAAAKGTPGVVDAASAVTRGVGSLFSGAAWFGMQLFTTFMALFFFFRDRDEILGKLRSLMPLSDAEARLTFRRTHDVIHATVYGSLLVALIQGVMGGLIFWWLELPAPLVWGTVMGLLAVVPVLGTFVIWAPTALILALQGDWTSAAILVAWGLIAIGMIDNFLYPFLVGHKMRFHTLAVFIAMLGGLAMFGASGVILGPLVLAVADALLEIWRRRTAAVALAPI